jgi:carboxymethylenebutenolidase
MSGQYITTVSAKFPTRFVAAASLYGVGLITDKPDSPHLLLNDIKGELYYGFAETDRSVPADIPPKMQEYLSKSGVKHTLKVFSGTEHGYTFAERTAYHPVASEQTWTDMFEMWDRRLK